ncbi:hypothetical protein HK405_009920, partial [Cladochytrium tenue]
SIFAVNQSSMIAAFIFFYYSVLRPLVAVDKHVKFFFNTIPFLVPLPVSYIAVGMLRAVLEDMIRNSNPDSAAVSGNGMSENGTEARNTDSQPILGVLPMSTMTLIFNALLFFAIALLFAYSTAT